MQQKGTVRELCSHDLAFCSLCGHRAVVLPMSTSRVDVPLPTLSSVAQTVVKPAS